MLNVRYALNSRAKAAFLLKDKTRFVLEQGQLIGAKPPLWPKHVTLDQKLRNSQRDLNQQIMCRTNG
jgi:hypothetical protein